MSTSREARHPAAFRVAAARERVGLIRRRVAVSAFSIFTAAWVGVFGQLAAGQDPALARGTSKAGRTPISASSTNTATAQLPADAVVPAAPATVAATPLTTRQS